MRDRRAPGLQNYQVTPNVEVRDQEEPLQFVRDTFVKIAKAYRDMAMLLEDKTHRVDEYRVQTLAADSESVVSLQPEFEVSEIITSVIATGPAGAFTLKLGKRVWPLVMPAEQILVIAPVQFSLSRQDDRQLIGGAPGDWSLELCGYADYTESYRAK